MIASLQAMIADQVHPAFNPTSLASCYFRPLMHAFGLTHLEATVGRYIATMAFAMLIIPLSPNLASAQASKTVYTYDALGRVTVVDALSTSSPSKTTIEYDPSGNRRTYTVSGSSDGDDSGSGVNLPGGPKFIVVPLNGFTLIPVF